jgi:hypothetical protein
LDQIVSPFANPFWDLVGPANVGQVSTVDPS